MFDIQDFISNLPGAGLFGLENPANSAMPYLDQIPAELRQYFNPYIQAGLASLPTLTGQYNSLISDPTGISRKIGSSFQQSPGYQFNIDQATKAANQAAAAGGLLGSPAEQQELAKTVSGFANQDYYNYLNQNLGNYFKGLGGLGDINNMGFQASTGLAENLAGNLGNQAGLSYAGKANQNQQFGNLFGNLIGLFSGGGFL